jgi:hypothetical protein
MLSLLLTVTLILSVYLTAVAIFFQFIIYPLFNKVSSFDFECYFKKYLQQIAPTIFPVLVIDVLLTFILPFMTIREGLTKLLLLSFGMMAFAYLNLLLKQVPLNLQLKERQNPVIIINLIKNNWICVISCTFRTLILFWILTHLNS